MRAVRIRRGLRQADVAVLAGVSQAIVSQIEKGDLERTSLRLLRRVAAAVGVSLPFAPRWRGAELAKLLDEKHAAMVREVVTRLSALGWVTLPEHTFSVRGERGSIDVLAWLPAPRALLVVEVKTLVADLQDLLSTLDRKRRLSPSIAVELGWRPLLIGTVLVMPGETQARNAVELYRPVFDAAYPARARQVHRWLRCPERDLRGIWYLLNFNPGGAKRRQGGSLRVRPRSDRRSAGGLRSSVGPPEQCAPGSTGRADGSPAHHQLR
jgi:DNA-binding XRE family transcriptional regulator